MGGDKEVGVRGMGKGVVELPKLRKTMMLGHLELKQPFVATGEDSYAQKMVERRNGNTSSLMTKS